MTTYTGTSGNDLLEGSTGDDLIYGLEGADLLIGIDGIDWLFGGAGDDLYRVNSQADLVFENPGEGWDAVESTASYYLYSGIEALALMPGSGNIFGVGNDLDNLLIGNDGENLLIGGLGNDELQGHDARDALFGQDGNDTLFGGNGIDYIVAGSGDDIATGGLDPDEIYGEEGNDQLLGGDGFFTDILVGGSGDDVLGGNSGLGDYDWLYGNEGNDVFFVDTAADLVFEQPGEGDSDAMIATNITGGGVYLYANVEDLQLWGSTYFGVGNELANRIAGSSGDNLLIGGAGNDTLNGWEGNDYLFGESGADIFQFYQANGADVIGDFEDGIDKIDISSFGYNWDGLSLAIGQNGNDSFINLGFNNVIVLTGVAASALDQTDFIFG
jgi:Ca2+-binding RTX toxin-like protein